MNEKVINGGTSIVTFISSEELSDLYVGIKGLKGYFECPAVSSVEQVGNSYAYEVTLLLSQYLSETFAVSLSAVSKSGDLNVAVNSDDVEVITVATGKLQISLSWDQLDDVDLYLFEPDENVIYYGNIFSSDNALENIHFICYLIEKYTDYSTQGLNFENDDDLMTLLEYSEELPQTIEKTKEMKEYFDKNKGIRGFLDLDSNAGCALDRINNENITYPTVVRDGIYTIAVDLYEKCAVSRPGAKYAVTVSYDGKSVSLSSKQTGKFSDSFMGSEGENPTIIGSFRISNGKLEVVESRSMEPRSSGLSDPRISKLLKQLKK